MYSTTANIVHICTPYIYPAYYMHTVHVYTLMSVVG